MKILCLDFDGVIHSYTSGWRGPRTIPDPPVPGAMHFLVHAIERLWLPSVLSPLDAEHAGLEFSERVLARIQFPRSKPAAWLHDRAKCFDGTWPSLDSWYAAQKGSPR